MPGQTVSRRAILLPTATPSRVLRYTPHPPAGDGYAALDWDPDLRQSALLMKRFD